MISVWRFLFPLFYTLIPTSSLVFCSLVVSTTLLESSSSSSQESIAKSFFYQESPVTRSYRNHIFRRESKEQDSIALLFTHDQRRLRDCIFTFLSRFFSHNMNQSKRDRQSLLGMKHALWSRSLRWGWKKEGVDKNVTLSIQSFAYHQIRNHHHHQVLSFIPLISCSKLWCNSIQEESWHFQENDSPAKEIEIVLKKRGL